MSTTLPVTFRASPLNPLQNYTPQEFLDAIVSRLSIESQDDLSFFVIGSVAPTSNVGPWLKNGVTWYVWDDVSGAYVPETLEYQSLRYIVSQTAPDNAIYTFWIQVNSSGAATAIKTYSSGAWNDVYAAAFTAAATATAKAYNTYPCGVKISGPQTISVDTNAHKVTFNTVGFDTNAAFNTTNSSYVAPVAGVYEVSCNLQVDNGTATAATMELTMNCYVNEVPAPIGPYSGDSTPSPNGARWWPKFTGQVQVNASDRIAIYLTGNDGVNTGNVVVAPQSQFFIKLVRAA